LVAYSTVAQIGYLFLMFPLAFDVSGTTLIHGAALDAGVLQAVSHATAKAGMFMAAGLIYASLGHDRIADLAGVARAMPITVLAFAVAGLALMGVVPSGAYLAKKLLLDAAGESGQWWWMLVLQGGAAFTAGYMVLVLANVFRRPSVPVVLLKRASRLSEAAALSLAVCSLLLALAALGPVSGDLISNPLAPKELLSTLAVVVCGGLMALMLSRRSLLTAHNRAESSTMVRRAGGAVGAIFERLDEFARRWASASILLLSLAGLFAWLMIQGVAR
jgi:NADH:ubiquinone oxidoreductase subunit 5 (subunit L)/multisubunit Na+/H+ antiporter MnhA subunit